MQSFVFTGPPCSGKSTLCERLRNLGYTVIDESAMTIIQTLNQRLGVAAQARWQQQNPLAFHQLILCHQLAEEKRIFATASPSETIILDRCRLDILAYLRLAKIEPGKDFTQLICAQRYNKILFLEPLPLFTDRRASGRIDNYGRQLEIAESLKEVYWEQGYRLESIAAANVEQRLAEVIVLIQQPLQTPRHHSAPRPCK